MLVTQGLKGLQKLHCLWWEEQSSVTAILELLSSLTSILFRAQINACKLSKCH